MTGVADPLGFAVRLLRKKYREGARVAVYAPPPVLQRLDQMLWVGEPLDFTPHVWLRAGAAPPEGAMLARTPLWLLAKPEPALDCGFGVNLGCDGLALAAAHARVAEIVPADDPEAAAAGRRRWKAYEAEGHALTHHPQR